MIHAEYCYDSDPIDRWFEEEIEITDLLYWHLERYFDVEHIRLEDKEHWVFYKHWGGYRITLGEMLNQPVRAILNEPGVWVPDKFETFGMGSLVVIEVNGAEVYRRASTPNIISVLDQGKSWAAKRLADGSALPSYIQIGGNNDGSGGGVATAANMTSLIGPDLGLAVLTPSGGTVQGRSVVYFAVLDLAAGPYQVGELGLFTRNRKMIAREALATRITKSPGDAFAVTWTITIA